MFQSVSISRFSKMNLCKCHLNFAVASFHCAASISSSFYNNHKALGVFSMEQFFVLITFRLSMFPMESGSSLMHVWELIELK
ncbi:hypothetical protein EUGRSUZ_H03828 [Eucalyptus grandis]|uniref:Uncharacterized protein n=2 Tax=Eucalyptus grandis TaxID=71139 RepID=A0ACC3JUQ7_EUCGR|nr:hypothetical protein EUGRSUZ_H03828 [Eucalyptus grandis]